VAFEVYIPPEPRLYRQYFLSQCKPGERLTIVPRQTKILFGRNSTMTTLRCPQETIGESSADERAP